MEEAVAEYTAAVRLKPDYAEARSNLAAALAALGRTTEAAAQYREVLRQKPDSPATLGKLAWLLATRAEPGSQNGLEAVQLAERLCQITSRKSAAALDVLAAAYAAAGRFGDAVRAAQNAFDLSTAGGESSLARQIQERLTLYQADRPYREGSQKR